MKKQLDCVLPWGLDYCPICGSIKVEQNEYCVECIKTKLRNVKIKKLIEQSRSIIV